MRLSGLASGMDTESMIKEMMKTERIKVDKLNQGKQTLLWRQETLNSLNKSLVNFILDSKKKFGVTTSYSGAISYKNIGWSKTATLNTDAKSTAIASPSAIDGKHSVEVERIAEGVTAVSKGDITKADGKKDFIANQLDGFGKDDIMEFTVSGKNGDVTFIVGNTEDGKGNVADLAADAKANIVRITKTLDKVSLSEITSKINNATVAEYNNKGELKSTSALGMKASYDEKLDRFFIQTRDTGESAKMSFKGAPSTQIEVEVNGEMVTQTVKSKGQEFLEALQLGVTSYEADPDNEGKVKSVTSDIDFEKVYNGTGAKVNYSIGGVIVKEGITSETNSFNINGINFTANAVETVEINIGTNVDDVYDKVKEFIDGYNKIVDEMNALVSEKTYRGFTPLTAEQKEAMSDEEVKLWEVKARSGVLKGDNTITKTLQSVRAGIYDAVEGVNGAYNHITQIGITTEKYAIGASGGRLEISEVKLKEAIANDANGVLDLLFKSPTGKLDTDDDNLSAADLKSKRKESGIITRMYHNLAAGMKDIVERSGVGEEINLLREVRARITQDFATKSGNKSLLDKNIFDYDKQIDRMNIYLSNREQYYYSKFSAMEQAMQKANSQSSWLMQQFGGGQ